MQNSPFPQIVSLNYEDEVAAFCERNQHLVRSISKLFKAMDESLIQVLTKKDDRLGLSVHMLVRLCSRHYEAIYHLCSSGHGFSAYRILRSLFEKYVDAIYLTKNPNQIDDFWEYAYIDLKRDGHSDQLKEIDEDYEVKIERFYNDNPRRRAKRPRWSKRNLKQKAEDSDVPSALIAGAYDKAHDMVHSSMTEILESLFVEDNGTLSPADRSSIAERRRADICMKFATPIAVLSLKLLVEHFKIVEPPSIDEFFSEWLREEQQRLSPRHST